MRFILLSSIHSRHGQKNLAEAVPNVPSPKSRAVTRCVRFHLHPINAQRMLAQTANQKCFDNFSGRFSFRNGLTGTL